MEKTLENEMATGLIMGYIGVIMGFYWDNNEKKLELLFRVSGVRVIGFGA